MLTWLTETEISAGVAILCVLGALALMAAASELLMKIDALRAAHSIEDHAQPEPTTKTDLLDTVEHNEDRNDQNPNCRSEPTKHERDIMLAAAKVHAVRAYIGEGLVEDLRDDYDEQTARLLKDAPELERHGDIILLAAFEIITDFVAKYVGTGRTDLNAFLNDWHDSVVEAYKMEVELHQHG